MRFGLRNALATFQWAIYIILSACKWSSCMVYLDYIIIFSKNTDYHLKHMKQLLTLLLQAWMTLRLNKCFFIHRQIKYFVHIVKPVELHVANKVNNAVHEMEPPSTKTKLRSFLGMCNAYRKFVKDFATIATPLNKLFKVDGIRFNRYTNKGQQQSFEKLKEGLASPPILALPRADLPYILDTDTNAEQIRCLLAQRHGPKDLRPIGYFSKKLTDTELNYRILTIPPK